MLNLKSDGHGGWLVPCSECGTEVTVREGGDVHVRCSPTGEITHVYCDKCFEAIADALLRDVSHRNQALRYMEHPAFAQEYESN
jgi:hypothetical protein